MHARKAKDFYIRHLKRCFSYFANFILDEVSHSSAFQTISVRSVYNKIINHCGSKLANLNKTIQTKQYNEKKPFSFSKRNKIYQGLFLWWKDLLQKMFKIVSILTLFNVSLFLEVLIYLMRQKYVKQDSNNIFLKKFLY